MSIKTIYDRLRKEGMSHAGAIGMMCNMAGESSFVSNIAQRGMTNLSDDEYTAKFDADPNSCIRDSVGYGLCQWTFHTRKRNLALFASNMGVSVGDEDMQVRFAVRELKTEYEALWAFLQKTEDDYTATRRVCCEFERPAVNNVDARYSFKAWIEDAISSADSYEPEQTDVSLDDIADMLVAIANKLRGIRY